MEPSWSEIATRTIGNFVTGMGFACGTCLLLAVVAFIGKAWIKARIEKAIQFEYGTKLEEFRFDLVRRQQAAMIAELFAEWVGSPEPTLRLQQLVWEAELWLPDHLAQKLNKTLCRREDAPHISDVLIDVRRLLHDESHLSSDDITYFDISQE